MRIGNNISAMNTLNRLSANTGSVSKSLEKLSSGSAINRAADNAAGLAISEKMRAQIAGLEQASKNAQDGISLVQTAEGALDQTHTALRRMYSLAMQAVNGTITTEDRMKIQAEVAARTNEIDRVAETANFNGIKLFDGNLDATATGIKYTAKAEAADVKAGKATTAATAPAAATLAVTGTGTFGAITFKDAAATKAATDANNALNAALKNGINVKVGSDGANPNSVTFELAGYTVTGAIDLTKTTAQNLTIKDAAGKEVATTTFTLSANISTETLVAENTVNFKYTGGADGNAEIKLGDTIEKTKNGAALELQIGASADAADKISVSIDKMDAASLLGTLTAGADGKMTLDVSTPDNANKAIAVISNAIEKVSEQRANLGATQNRLEQTIENLSTTAENMSAAESRIRDVDMAKEMTTFTKFNILSQAAQAMLAQANAQPQGVLQLLK